MKHELYKDCTPEQMKAITNAMITCALDPERDLEAELRGVIELTEEQLYDLAETTLQARVDALKEA